MRFLDLGASGVRDGDVPRAGDGYENSEPGGMVMSTRLSRFLLIAVIACLLALPALAQTSTTGLIEGRVRDQAGNPIKEATVSAVANRAPASAVVDAQGRFTIANLPPGTYKVRAEAPGKAAVVQDEIVVSINTRTHVDFTLARGQTDTVTVTAQSPTIDTKSVTTGGTFNDNRFL